MGLETTETIILESGTSLLALGLALLTGGIVGALLVRRQYGAVLPLGLLLAAVALLLWGGPLARVLVSFLLLLISYTWLLAWWRASQQGRDQAPSQQSRLARGGGRSSRNMGGALADSIGRNRCASTTRTTLEMRQTDESTCLAGSTPWDCSGRQCSRFKPSCLKRRSISMTDTTKESTGPRSLAPTTSNDPTKTLQNTPPLGGTPSPLLPQRGLASAMLSGVLAGVFTALLTIVLVLVFAATFQAARQQMAVDRLTVKTALALAGVGLLMLLLSLLAAFVVGVIVGRIVVQRRLGFLAGALAGAVFSLLIFLVSLIPNYPGNLAGNGTTMTTWSLVLAFLLLCLGSIGGGFVSLFGAWVATVKHPHYLRLGG